MSGLVIIMNIIFIISLFGSSSTIVEDVHVIVYLLSLLFSVGSL